MKPLLTALCLLCGILCGACARHVETPKPLLVVVTYYMDSPPGGGSPTFALYDDGSIICYHEPARGEYPPPEKLFTIRKVRNPEKKVEELLTFGLTTAKTLYVLSNATDLPVTFIWTPTKTIAIYGDWKAPLKFDSALEEDPRIQEINKRNTAMWKSLPDEIRQFLLHIEKENAIAGTPWLPEKFDPASVHFPFPCEELWQSKAKEFFQKFFQ